MNIYIVYEINVWAYKQGADSTVTNFYFRAVKMTENGDLDKSKYYRDGLGFDVCRKFSLSDGSVFG